MLVCSLIEKNIIHELTETQKIAQFLRKCVYK